MPEYCSYEYGNEDCDCIFQEEVIDTALNQDQVKVSGELKDSDCVCKQTKLPYFKSVSVVNSNDVHFGNKTVYKGPVIIKQIVCPSGEIVSSECESDLKESLESVDLKNTKNGIYNPSFVKDEREPKTVTTNDSLPRCDRSTLFYNINQGFRCCYLTIQNHRYKAFVFIASIITTAIIVLTVLFFKNVFTRRNPYIVPENREEDNNITFDYVRENPIPPHRGLRMIKRLQWLAQPATGTVNNLTLPVSIVIIQHSATESCTSQAECIFQTRTIQTFHIESHKWFDIGYNFLIGGDGGVYEGRGWTKEGAHTYSYNNISVGIAFIGTFSKDAPPLIMLDSFRKLVANGVKLNYLSSDYKILAHRQLIATESPGLAFFELIKKWPHWSQNIN